MAKAIRYGASALVILLCLMLVVNWYICGSIKSIEFMNFKVGVDGAPMSELCIPWFSKEVPTSTTVVIRKNTADSNGKLGDWTIDGSDGQGGHRLRYDFAVPGTITGIGQVSSNGNGGNWWICPNPRCGKLGEISNAGNVWTAHSATNGGPATEVTYKVEYLERRKMCLFRNASCSR